MVILRSRPISCIKTSKTPTSIGHNFLALCPLVPIPSPIDAAHRAAFGLGVLISIAAPAAGRRSPLGRTIPAGAPRRGRQRRYVPPAAGRACIFLCSAHGAFCAATNLWATNESTGSEAEAFGRFVSPLLFFSSFFPSLSFLILFSLLQVGVATWQKSTFWPSFLSPLGQFFRHLFQTAL